MRQRLRWRWGLVAGLLLCSWCAGARGGQPATEAPFRVSDPLSDQARFDQQWDADFAWQVQASALTCTAPNRQLAVLRAGPAGRQVTVEAVVTARQAIGTDWKMAGIGIYRDATNYWTLSLCESPQSKDGQHFIDFNEMRSDVWLAQWEDKLPPMPGPDLPAFQWQYGRPYRLRLEMTGDAITGSVYESDGTLRWKSGFALSKSPAVTDGRPALVMQAMRGEFRDLKASIAQRVAPPDVASAYPPFSGKAYDAIRGEKSGFFHTQKLADTWWIIDPAGHGTFYLGTDHANYNVHWCEALGYAPYHRNVQAKYGSEQTWAKATADRLVAWGFNGVGVNASPTLLHRGLSHTSSVDLGLRFCELGPEYRITFPDNGQPVPCSYFPNVFHPRFEEFCRKTAKRACAASAQDPWLLGRFIDNELAWWGKTWGERDGLFDECMRKPPEHAAKQAVVDWLRKRYPNPADLAQAWGATVPSYDALLKSEQVAGTRGQRIEQDKQAFVQLIADRYFAIATAAIREADPNHMILGARFAGPTNPAYENAWAAAGKYCDIVSINIYETVDLRTGQVYAAAANERIPLADLLDDIHARTGGKPLMVTEWSFPAYDSGLPNTTGAGQRVNTQAERTFCFESFQKLLLSRPYMVGSSYFMWADEPAQGISRFFPEDSNYGLVNVDDEPYELLTQAATRLHPLAGDIHAGKTIELRVTPADEEGTVFIVENTGSVGGDCTVTLRDGDKAIHKRLFLAPGAQQAVGDELPPDQETGRLVVCTATPAEGLAELTSTDNTAMRLLPGRAQAKGLPPSGWRIPLVVANPLNKPLPAASPLVIRIANLPAGIDWKAAAPRLAAFDISSGTARPTPAQLDDLPDGAELAIALPALAPLSACTLVVCDGGGATPPAAPPPVRCQSTADRLEISNGPLRLTRNGPGGAIFDQITLNGTQIGRLDVMIHQALPANRWPQTTRLEQVRTYVGPVRAVVDLVLSAEGDAPYRAAWRITVHPNTTWFTTQPLGIENTGTTPWNLVSYFHAATSNLAGKDADDAPQGPVWRDSAATLAFGVIDPAGGCQGTFWKESETGLQHPDYYRPLNVRLAPGQRYTQPQPHAYIAATKGPWPRAWLDLDQQIRDRSQLLWRAGPVE